jgi:Predicted methyltransferase regulatory domain/Methyltransferase domain
LNSEQNPHDAVRYPGLAFSNTHPERLAAMAILHGLEPAPVERCRVLEVACNQGANLIPMAYAIPGSEFVGFDLARLPVERGQQRIKELGLKNIRVFASDLLDVGAELGRFDYIIAHGFYSWVPEPVRDRLLALCRELLTPQGIAFVSYNALPGGYVRSMIREMMLYLMHGTENVDHQVGVALGLVHFLLDARAESDPFRRLVEEHLHRMEERRLESTFHDELCDVNQAVHFVEFAQHAQRHGLQYLSEAKLPPSADPGNRPQVREAVEKVAPGDIFRQEQMLDFARARKYRETLLCRAECDVSREVSAERLRKLLFSSPVSSSPGKQDGATVFTLSGGASMESNHPGAVAVLRALEQAWPRALRWAEIEPRFGTAGFELNTEGAALLMRLAAAELIELHGWRAELPQAISPHPKASECSRQEAAVNGQATTLFHSMVRFDDPIAHRLFLLLDGSRGRGELAEALKADFSAVPSEDIEMRIEPSLEFFFKAGFLEA